jgi:hypothetical protein
MSASGSLWFSVVHGGSAYSVSLSAYVNQGQRAKVDKRREQIVEFSQGTKEIRERGRYGMPRGVAKNGHSGRPLKKAGDPKSPYTITKKYAETHNLAPMDGEEAEFNRRTISHALAVASLAPVRGRALGLEDLPALREAFLNYLELCDQNGMRAGMQGASAALGVDYSTVTKWANGIRGKEFQELALTIKQVLATAREEMVATGKLNPVIGIFWQRNYDGLRNDTEQVQSAQALEEESFDRNGSYKDKYKKLIGG